MSIIRSSKIKIGNYVGASTNSLSNHETTSFGISNLPKENQGGRHALNLDPNDYVPKRFALKYNPPAVSKILLGVSSHHSFFSLGISRAFFRQIISS